MAQQRWQEAATAFATSMQIRATASAALNLGISLKHLGRLVEARLRLQQFLEMASDTLRREHGDQVQELLLQIARDLARVRIIELTPTLAAVSVDGRRVQPNEAGEVVVDPGAHTVRAEATGFIPFEERVMLSPGGTRELRIVMRLVPGTGGPPTLVEGGGPQPVGEAQPASGIDRFVQGDDVHRVLNQPVVEGRPVYRQWWFWTLLGVAVAGVATGVVLASQNAVRNPPPTSTGVILTGISVGGSL
jgi:hypothetical protein